MLPLITHHRALFTGSEASGQRQLRNRDWWTAHVRLPTLVAIFAVLGFFLTDLGFQSHLNGQRTYQVYVPSARAVREAQVTKEEKLLEVNLTERWEVNLTEPWFMENNDTDGLSSLTALDRKHLAEQALQRVADASGVQSDAPPEQQSAEADMHGFLHCPDYQFGPECQVALLFGRHIKKLCKKIIKSFLSKEK